MNVRQFLDKQGIFASGSAPPNGHGEPDLIDQMREEARNGTAHIPPSGFGMNPKVKERGRRLTFYVLPFGKYKDMSLHEAPKDYLRWCLSKDERAVTIRARYPELQAEIEAHFNAPVEAVLEQRIANLVDENACLKQQHDADTKIITRLSVGLSEFDKLKRELRYAEQAIASLVSTCERYRMHIAEQLPKKSPAQPAVSSLKLGELRGIVKRWFRSLSLKYHPDRGGTAEKAAIVNEAYSTLIKEIDAWQAAES